jgi:S-DNA-T family DNA segregation ATPase FtsK/SpoIIIE
MPFDRVVPAPEIPGDPREVDLSVLDVGDDEHGNPLTVGVLGKHVFVAGASGAGKGSLL